MSQYKKCAVADTVYFWFVANNTAGEASDGANPLFHVRLGGEAADATPIVNDGTPVLLSHANYPAGLYEITIDTTGYAAGEYAIFCTLLISSVNPGGFVGSVKVSANGPLIDIADTILARDIGSGIGAGSAQERTVRSALRALRNKWSLLTGTYVVTKEDDATTAWSASASSNAAAEPVVGCDPV